VALRTVAGRRTGESADDLESWLVQLKDCPPVTRTIVTTCDNASHGTEPAMWFYVEADPDEAVARHRCMSCGQSQHVLDSAEHWNFPHMWSCPSCSQSIAEIAAGVHCEAPDQVTWIALAARCVECGTIDGLTDFTIEPTPADVVLRQL
jgi:ferredoxin-like protein FixX